MKEIRLGEVLVGTGLPKICVPLMASTEPELIRQATLAQQLPCELVEWRADCFSKKQLWNVNRMEKLAESIRETAGKPLILTVRTEAEGGLASLPQREYNALIRELAEQVPADALDIEAFHDKEEHSFHAERLTFLIGIAHSCGKGVILSHHDFEATPEINVMVKWLVAMQELGADIPKIAVMPSNREDVLRLLEAARIMHEQYARRPFIALSMGTLGQVTRVCGGQFGSAITFASGGDGMKASAPGQMDATQLRQAICEFYSNRV